MLEQVAELLNVPQERVEGVRRREEAALTDALGRLAIHYYAAGFQREFALVGETAQVIGLVEFLVGTLGLLPRLVVVTDNPPEPLRAGIIELLNSRLDSYAAAVVFSEESGEISDLVRASGAELVLGSSLEQRAAAALGAPLLQVAFPVSGRLILDRGYAGYRGAVTLLEDLGGAILSHGGRG